MQDSFNVLYVIFHSLTTRYTQTVSEDWVELPKGLCL